MAVKEDSKRRINLKFDDLEQDILEWLNSFGKGKRAKIAKAAIRKAMIEGQSAKSLLNAVAAQSDFSNNSIPISKRDVMVKDPIQGKSETTKHEQVKGQCSQEDENFKYLLGLTGSEESTEILKLI